MAMAARLEVFHLAWVNVSLVALLLIVALTAAVSRSDRRAGDPRIGQLSHASIRMVLALGVLYLMVAKSEIVGSLIVMAFALALGAVAATRTKLAVRVLSREALGGASARV